jgi:3-hydroxyethyl bacteriochlorophyllide a dehydrogenase
MMRQTQAVVITKPGEVGLEAVALRPFSPQDVLIQTAYTSISAGTERMLLAGQMPHPMLQLPVIPGYETVGRIVELGDEVDPSWLNRWVYVGGAQCYDGINAAWGGQSAQLAVDVSRVIPLEQVDPHHGVLLALAATALHGVNLLNPQPGDRVLVLGQGPVGQLAARLARIRGAWVAVADRNQHRLALSEADQIVPVGEGLAPLSEQIEGGVTAVIEATGSMEALTSTLPLLTLGGTVLLLGYYQTLQLPYMPLFLKEARLLTAKEWAPGDLLHCRNLIAEGTLDVAAMLTHCLPISEVATAYDVALNDANCLKLVLDWQTVQSN